MGHALKYVQVPIKKWDLYRRALFRASSVSPGSSFGSIASGQALGNIEFLGDSLVNATVRRAVNKEYPDAPMSDLTKLTRKFIAGIFMYRIGMLLQLDKFVVAPLHVRPAPSRL
jgi:dsRNA-specific ribonuclease